MSYRKKIKSKSLISQKRMRVLMSLLFLSPWIIGFLLFALWPFIQMARFSVSNVIFRPNDTLYDFVGMQNFRDVLFVDPDFRLMIMDYFQMIVLMLPIIMVFALILATLLNGIDTGKSVFRSIYFLPVIIISGPLLENLFAIEAFSLDGLYDFFVFEFIQDVLPAQINQWFFFLMDNIILALWFSGVQLLIFLTGMQRIDNSIYEAAKIEGASAWQIFWKITIPMLKPFIILNAIYTLVDLSNSSLSPISELINMSKNRDDRGYGYAAAVSWLYLLVVVVILLVILFILAKDHQAAREQREKRAEEKKIKNIRRRRDKVTAGLGQKG